MSYLAQFSLTTYDPHFRGRLSMCVAEQAKGFRESEDDASRLLADQALGSYMSVTEQMLPLVTTQPGITTDSTDQEIMAAVQYLWPILGARLLPPPPVMLPSGP
jgi:hypothetical protein